MDIRDKNNLTRFKSAFGSTGPSKIPESVQKAWSKVEGLVQDYAEFWDRVLSKTGGRREPDQRALDEVVADIVRERRGEGSSQSLVSRSLTRSSSDKKDFRVADSRTDNVRDFRESGSSGIQGLQQEQQQGQIRERYHGSAEIPQETVEDRPHEMQRKTEEGMSYRYQEPGERTFSPELADIQEKLYSLKNGKYYPGGSEEETGDGYYGDNTANAIARFAADHGISTNGEELTHEILDIILYESMNQEGNKVAMR
jgi:hypothetical protein